MSRGSEHHKLVNEILLAVGSLPYARCWKRNVGLAVPIGTNRPVYYGIEGEADLDGILMPHGQKLAIEVKTGDGKLSKVQIRYRDMIVRFGGLYVLARCVNDAVSSVQEAYARNHQSP